METPVPSRPDRRWPHAPPHWGLHPGTYLITAATLHHRRIFDRPEALDLVQRVILDAFLGAGWTLLAWAFLINHYHALGRDPRPPDGTDRFAFLREAHRRSALEMNRLDGTPGRRVWFNFHESRITYPGSFLARLRYVHQNPVHHRIVRDAREYRWCSAAAFEATAPAPFRASVARVALDRLVVPGEPRDPAGPSI